MKFYLYIFILLIFLNFSFPLFAQDLANIEAVEACFDGMIMTHMKDKQLPGASLSVVKDGEIIIKKGYGFADWEKRKKVDPDKTLFRIGSISKVFNWIAVMQLVEQGRLDLDRDVNEYLEEFKVPETYEQPVTLRSLMSHTPGFEERVLQLFVKDSADMRPLNEILRNQMPARVRPPLTMASYSNHGTGLASYLVELKSGKDFETYAEDHIFQPLQLENITFRQPLPGNLKNQMSKGYKYEEGTNKEQSFEFVPMAGVGAASASAGDMAKVMLALLNNTCLEGACLMDSITYDLMKKPVLVHAPEVNAALMGFMDLSLNNVKIFGHGGDSFWFHSIMALYPDQNFGFFLTFNSEKGNEAYLSILSRFTDQYFPVEKLRDIIKMDEDHLKKFAGAYKNNRHPVTDISKLLTLFVTVNIHVENGGLVMPSMHNVPETWLPVDSTTFRKEGGSELLIFQLNKDNEVEHAFLSNWGIFAFDKVRGGWYPSLHFSIIGLTLIFIIYILFIWPLIYFLRRGYRNSSQRLLPVPFKFKSAAWLCAASLFLFYIFMLTGLSVGVEIVYSIPASITIGLFFPFLAIFFLLLMVIFVIKIWRVPKIRLMGKIFYSMAIIVFAAAIWQLYFWNFLGWHY